MSKILILINTFLLHMRKTYGPLKAKKCKKGKPCGGSCISRTNTCRISLSKSSSKNIDAAVKAIRDSNPYDIQGSDPTRDHIVSRISDVLNVPKTESEDIYDSLMYFVEEDYLQVREIDKNGPNSSKFEPQAIKAQETISEFLERSPKYKGDIYRGVNFGSPEELQSYLEELTEGGSARLEAMSSFSASRAVAERFTSRPDLSAIIKVKDSEEGVSIANITGWLTEEEILVPKNSTYRLLSADTNSEGLITIELGR